MTAPDRASGGADPRARAGAAAGGGPVLLYDGVCALCNWTVRVVLRLDRRGRIRFAPLGGAYATRVLERHPEARDVDSLILVEPGRAPDSAPEPPDGPGVAGAERVHVKSEAVLRLAHGLGGIWRAAGVLRVVPRPVRDWAYDAVARRRYAVFGRLARRPDPPAIGRGRFLD